MNLFWRTVAITALMFSRSAVANQIDDLTINGYAKSNETIESNGTNNLFLDKLMSIESGEYDVVKQKFSNLDDLYTIAPEAKAELNAILDNITRGTSSDYMAVPIKSYDRAQAKVDVDLAGDASRITDVVRDSVVTDSIYEVYKTYKGIASRAHIVKVKNRFKTPTDSGYRDLSLLIKLKNTGVIAEVQIHLRAIEEAKSGAEHDVYRAIQNIHRSAIQSGKPLSEFEVTQIEDAKEQSKLLYKRAWDMYQYTA